MPEAISESTLVVTLAGVLSLMEQFEQERELYPLYGGVHAPALSDTKNLARRWRALSRLPKSLVSRWLAMCMTAPCRCIPIRSILAVQQAKE